ncbi:helix-turn-helix transcriptional regulator [Streptomyces sp. NPDC005423]|uniref:helix-turn-helix transcriptional regulator n=1 Tax=Streptomyces sp. NPDC005423 TaxID=3155343 RepID=UPI00339F0CEB
MERDSADGSGNRADVRDFLISRRARITPDQVGFPVAGRRRVPGLRREEVAVLAGVSTEWYVRLERGNINGVSRGVLEAVARALRLDDEERTYLLELAQAARSSASAPGPEPTPPLPANIQWLLDGMTLSAAMVSDSRQDVLAVNALGRALYAPLFASDTNRDHSRANLARYHFLDPGAQDFYGNWHETADMLVASLRAEAGRNPNHESIRDLVGELSDASAEFRKRWASHNILIHQQGSKTFRHPRAGELRLSYQSMDLPISAHIAVHVCTCTAEPGSAAEDLLKLLASWNAPLQARDSHSTDTWR